MEYEGSFKNGEYSDGIGKFDNWMKFLILNVKVFYIMKMDNCSTTVNLKMEFLMVKVNLIIINLIDTL